MKTITAINIEIATAEQKEVILYKSGSPTKKSYMWGIPRQIDQKFQKLYPTHAYAVTNRSPSAYQISTQSAQPLPSDGKRNI